MILNEGKIYNDKPNFKHLIRSFSKGSRTLQIKYGNKKKLKMFPRAT